MTTRVVIRADAGPKLGLGHVMRCLALAHALRDAGAAVHLLAHELPASTRARLEAEAGPVEEVRSPPGSAGDAGETLEVAARLGARWLVVDGYRFGVDYQRLLRAGAPALRLLWLDDTSTLPEYDVDLLLNQNLDAAAERYAGRLGPGARLLLGPRFALLRRELLAARRVEPGVGLVVSFGGADPTDATSRALAALEDERLRALRASIVVGPVNPRREALRARIAGLGPRVTLVLDPTDMGALLSGAGAYLGAAGSTLWELAYLGVPSLVVVVADNQRENARRADEEGFALLLGDDGSVGPRELAEGLHRLDSDPGLARALSAKGRRAVDGGGAARVVAALVGEEGLHGHAPSPPRGR